MVKSMKEDEEVRSLLSGGRNRLQKKPRYQTEGGSYWKEIPRTREIVDKSGWNSNGCCPLENTPMDYNFNFAALKGDETLKYDCFMPTGETYQFLPCAPWPLEAREVLGYQRFRGTDRIMEIEGDPVAQEAFVPYKLLLYKGRYNADTGYDDRHRFVYLAENKPKEPAVGDCFIRLEEIHKRMNGTEAEYIEDCKRYNTWDTAVRAASPLSMSKLNNLQKARAKEELKRVTQDGKWTLRFRCWTVDGKECEESEKRLRNRLFNDVFPANNERDHIAVFKVWAELLRNSQGDKLGAKDFFGRYWDAVIPNDWDNVFQNGFRIIVGLQWFQRFWGNGGDVELAYQNPAHRLAAKEKVFEGIQRAVYAPRLKFKPPLSVNNVFFEVELNQNANDCTAGWFKDGWRCLEGHPGGLYQIVVNLPVRLFLCLDTHKKPFWQEGYGHPQEPKAKSLNDKHLDLCRPHTTPTTTLINTTLLNNPIKKRNPPQDRCVATNGYSANVAMSGAFPNFYPNPATAKKKRVAEWLHRSAFSYGGCVDWQYNNSQTANNLVLGTPDTNTVMMRYEAFVKRLAMFSNNGQDAVIVQTEIVYPKLTDPGGWMGDAQHQYTWLAATLKYQYYNIVGKNANNINNVTKRGFEVTRNLFPFNRETCLLFQSILDKSLENLFWGWNCWDADRAVVDALLESTVIPGDQEEANKDEVIEKLKEATGGDQEGELNELALELVVQQNLAPQLA